MSDDKKATRGLERAKHLRAVWLFLAFLIPTLEAKAYTVNFVNHTGLPAGYTLCAQGFAAYTAANPPNPQSNFMVLSTTGNQASFVTTGTLTPAPSVGDALPAFAITPGTTTLNITTNSGTNPIQGARVYYYVVSGSSCFPYLYYSAVGNNGSVANNFPDGGAYIFSEITSLSDTTGGQTFDLSMVDSFSMPSNAVITSTTANYSTIGQSDTTLSSAQNLTGIRSDFSSAMTALGARGQAYLSLLASTFITQPSANSLPGGASITWPSYTYPSGTGPILNPHALLSQFIPNPPSPQPPVDLFMPGAGQTLNTVFDTALTTLFGRSSYLNKTGVSGQTFLAQPSTILPLPGGYSGPQNALLLQNYPTGLPGLALCTAGTLAAACGQSNLSNVVGQIYNPVNSTVLTTQPGGSQLITGSISASSSTLSFDNAVNLPAGVNIFGWYIKVNNSTVSDGMHYVTGCNGSANAASCTGSPLTSVTINQASSGAVPESQVVLGLFPANSSGPGQAGSFASSGDQVFGNWGVFGGTLTGSNGSLGLGTTGADIGNILVTALNRGVSGLTSTYNSAQDPQTTDSYQWAQETSWYPASATRNEYALYLHTRTLPNSNPNAPLFFRPTPAASSAGGTSPMGMAYGFGFDENPAPSYSGAPQVPSEWNQTVGGNITVTFGPWLITSPPGTFLLQVTKSGTGQSGGLVTSTPSGINCGSTCSQSYDAGTRVTLTAQGSASAVFTGWSGPCSGTGTCILTMSQAQSVTANFQAPAPGNYPLDVSVSGSGNVSSNPSGINCGNGSSACAQEETGNSNVTLTATPSGAATFLGWTGACTGSSTQCIVTMSQARSVAAAFGSINEFQLSVSTGTGGRVTSSPSGINCGAACLASFGSGTQVLLQAVPEPGYVFSGWGGDCSSFGSAACSLTMNANHTVTAIFTATHPGEYPLTVTVTGSGVVTSTPSGISCGSSCSNSYNYGTSVSLIATPANGYQLSGWYGPCSGTGTCTVTMDQAQYVTAKFVVIPPPAPIPGIDEWARISLLLSLAGMATWHLKRRRHLN